PDPAVTRISPSDPTPRWRSHSAAMRSGVRSRRSSGSWTITKSLQVPWYLAKARTSGVCRSASPFSVASSSCTSRTFVELHQVVDHRPRPLRPHGEPPDPRVAPEPRHLPPGQRSGSLHGAGDGLLQADPSGQVIDHRSVP